MSSMRKRVSKMVLMERIASFTYKPLEYVIKIVYPNEISQKIIQAFRERHSRIKLLQFFCPIQLLIHLQWWSKFKTQRSQRLQCLEVLSTWVQQQLQKNSYKFASKNFLLILESFSNLTVGSVGSEQVVMKQKKARNRRRIQFKIS